MNQNELYHYGILGQKWGIRRYQNPDGSLTKAGIRRYGTKTNFEKVQAAKRRAERRATIEKERAKRNARVQAEINKYDQKGVKKNKDASSDDTPKTKSISEMSNQEIQEKIDRIRLENTLRSLTPEKVSLGKRFVTSAVNDALIPAAKNAGRQFVENKLKDMMGLNDKDIKDTSKELQRLASDYENRQKIDKGQKYFKEGKYKDRDKDKETDSSGSSSDSDSSPTSTPTSRPSSSSTPTSRPSSSSSSSSSPSPSLSPTSTPTPTSRPSSSSSSDYKYDWNVLDHTSETTLRGKEYVSWLSKNETEFLNMIKKKNKK